MASSKIIHGTSSGYKKCRKRPKGACKKCRAYNNIGAARRIAKAKEELKNNPEKFNHGTPYTIKLGCDCPKCAETRKIKNHEYWENRKLKPTKEVPKDAHGTLRGYNYYKCRCMECRIVKSIYRQLMAARKEERARLDEVKRSHIHGLLLHNGSVSNGWNLWTSCIY